MPNLTDNVVAELLQVLEANDVHGDDRIWLAMTLYSVLITKRLQSGRSLSDQELTAIADSARSLRHLSAVLREALYPVPTTYAPGVH